MSTRDGGGSGRSDPTGTTTWDDYRHNNFQGTNYRVRGPQDGPVVVCVHGIGSFSVCFDGIATAFVERGFRVVTYDLLGRGHSRPIDPSSDKSSAELLVLSLIHI